MACAGANLGTMTFRLTRRAALALPLAACAAAQESPEAFMPREISPRLFETRTAFTETLTVRHLTMGEGRPTLLLHGFLADAQRNWVAPGIAARVSGAGRQAIMPDFLAHGGSDPLAAVDPPEADVLALQIRALIGQLQLTDYDLVGYSMGARTAVRLLVQGARPTRCVLGGMGDFGITNFAARQAQFETWLGNAGNASDAQSRAVAGLLAGKRVEDMLRVLRTQVATPAETLAGVPTPILVVSGVEDNDNGSAEGLAALFPNARAQRIPGNHLSAVAQPELGDAIVDFLNS